MLGRDRIQYKSIDQMRLMRTAGLLVADALDAAAWSSGHATTKELDAVAEDVIRSGGGTPSFLGYGRPAYPASTCIPGVRRCGPRHPRGSSAPGRGPGLTAAPSSPAGTATRRSAPSPGASPRRIRPTSKLMAVTEQAMWHGIAAIAVGERLNAIRGGRGGLRRRTLRLGGGVRRSRHRDGHAPGPARPELPAPATAGRS